MVEKKVRKELPDKYQRIILVVLILAVVAIAVELVFVFRNWSFDGPLEYNDFNKEVELSPAEYLQEYNATGSVENALEIIDQEVAETNNASEAFEVNRQRIDLFIISGNYQGVIDFYETVNIDDLDDSQKLFLYSCMAYVYQEMGDQNMVQQFGSKAEEIRAKMEAAAV